MIIKSLVLAAVIFFGSLTVPGPARADLVLLGQFTPRVGQLRLGLLVSLGFDSSTDGVWVFRQFDSTLRRYTRSGTFVSTINRPGESADDADITFAPETFTLGNTPVPAGSLLFVNGEKGTADIYAVNKSTGAVIARLVTAFGANHVVGVAYHAVRNTLFVVADRLDTKTPSTVAEINPRTGAVIRRFGTGSADFTVYYGDIEVSRTNGNLFLVSSVETKIRELTPTGKVVRDLPLPAGVRFLSGIGLDERRGEAFLSSTNGTVSRVRGLTTVTPAVEGAADGVHLMKVICQNETTGQQVITEEGVSAWDCEAAGLVVQAGDIIQQTVIGSADTTSTRIASSVAGVHPTNVICQNETTGQQVITEEGAYAWDCEAAGLVVQAGDIIQQTVIGTANCEKGSPDRYLPRCIRPNQ